MLPAVWRARLRSRWALAATSAVVAFLFVLAPIVRGRMAPIWDADGFFAPYYTLVADFAREGRLLLWNPWTNAGSPDHAEPQIGSFSPVVVLSALLTGGGERGYRIHWLCVWAFGMLGVVALGRRLRAPPVASAAVALSFAMSGPWLGNAQHLSFLFTYAFLPWVLLRLDVALTRQSKLAGAQAGALLGLSALGGYPGVLFVSGSFCALWVVGRIVASAVDRSERPLARERVLALTTFGVVAILAMLPAVLPMLLEGPGYTARSGPLSREAATTSNALHPMALVTFFSPRLAALPPRLLWPYTDRSSVSVYLGALPLFLAGFALLARPRAWKRWALLATAALFVALSLGVALPVRGWLYDLVPPSRYFRHASIFRFGAVFALALLALVGARDLFRARLELRRWAAVGLATALALVAWRVCGATSLAAGAPITPEATRHLLVAWGGVVGTSALGAWSRLPARAWVLGMTLAAVTTFDAAETFASSTTTATSTLVASWRDLDARRVKGLDLLAQDALARLPFSNDSTGLGPGPTDKNLLLRRPAFFAYAPLTPVVHERWARTPQLAAFTNGRDRTYFATDVVTAEPSAEAFEALAGRVVATGQMPLVVHPRGSMARLSAPAGDAATTVRAAIAVAPAAQPIALRWQAYRPTLVRFEVDAPAAGWLLFTDRWARGWRATVDGAATEVSGGNLLFRALPLQAGRHAVVLRYRPTGYPWVLVIGWSTLAAVLGATLFGRRIAERWRLARARAALQPHGA